jgi:hypothetical protein
LPIINTCRSKMNISSRSFRKSNRCRKSNHPILMSILDLLLASLVSFVVTTQAHTSIISNLALYYNIDISVLNLIFF